VKRGDPGAKGDFWPLHCVTGGGMEKRQITRQELVAAALKLGAQPGTIRQWFHRAIPYRWHIRLMEYFEGPVEISDWAPEATAAIARPRSPKPGARSTPCVADVNPRGLALPRRRQPAGRGPCRRPMSSRTCVECS